MVTRSSFSSFDLTISYCKSMFFPPEEIGSTNRKNITNQNRFQLRKAGSESNFYRKFHQKFRKNAGHIVDDKM